MKYIFMILQRALVCFVLIVPNISVADDQFTQWIKDFKSTAVQKGITASTYNTAFSGVMAPDEKVLKKARYQPEFTTEIWDYLDARVNIRAIEKGQKMARYYARTLESIELDYGVPKEILLAIWSMESDYGDILEKTDRLHYVPRALATLAYGDKRREKFAKNQLVGALEILQAGDIAKNQMMGSWAGAMGHTQFIPTSYLAYGVDMDKNGRRDIWNSIPDALATAANLLKKNGWRTGKGWGFEVFATDGHKSLANKTMTIKEWEGAGVKPAGKRGLQWPEDNGVLKMFAKESSPAFLVMKNFYILKRYNNADSYALGVGLLSDRIAGRQKMVQSWPRPPGSLGIREKLELQSLLKEHGFYSGEIDGYLGKGTVAAIKQFQQSKGGKVSGRPSQNLLNTLRKE